MKDESNIAYYESHGDYEQDDEDAAVPFLPSRVLHGASQQQASVRRTPPTARAFFTTQPRFVSGFGTAPRHF